MAVPPWNGIRPLSRRCAGSLDWSHSPATAADGIHQCRISLKVCGIPAFTLSLYTGYSFLVSQEPGAGEKVRTAPAFFPCCTLSLNFSAGSNFPIRSFVGPRDPPPFLFSSTSCYFPVFVFQILEKPSGLLATPSFSQRSTSHHVFIAHCVLHTHACKNWWILTKPVVWLAALYQYQFPGFDIVLQ